MTATTFWDVMPDNLVKFHWRFVVTYCLDIQGRRMCRACSKQQLEHTASVPRRSYYKWCIIHVKYNIKRGLEGKRAKNRKWQPNMRTQLKQVGIFMNMRHILARHFTSTLQCKLSFLFLIQAMNSGDKWHCKVCLPVRNDFIKTRAWLAERCSVPFCRKPSSSGPGRTISQFPV